MRVRRCCRAGTAEGCNATNQYCYVCEDPQQNETLADFRIWPEPYGSETWQLAVEYVEERADPNNFPVWNAGACVSVRRCARLAANRTHATLRARVRRPSWDADIIPNHTFVDTKNNNRTIMVPGTDLYFRLDRDPYADMVSLAVDLGADGVDLDYEEFWHADYFRQGPRPYDLQQTTYKFAAIVQDVMLNIAQSSNPGLMLAHAAGATGARLAACEACSRPAPDTTRACCRCCSQARGRATGGAAT